MDDVGHDPPDHQFVVRLDGHRRTGGRGRGCRIGGSGIRGSGGGSGGRFEVPLAAGFCDAFDGEFVVERAYGDGPAGPRAGAVNNQDVALGDAGIRPHCVAFDARQEGGVAVTDEVAVQVDLQEIVPVGGGGESGVDWRFARRYSAFALFVLVVICTRHFLDHSLPICVCYMVAHRCDSRKAERRGRAARLLGGVGLGVRTEAADRALPAARRLAGAIDPPVPVRALRVRTPALLGKYPVELPLNLVAVFGIYQAQAVGYPGNVRVYRDSPGVGVRTEHNRRRLPPNPREGQERLTLQGHLACVLLDKHARARQQVSTLRPPEPDRPDIRLDDVGVGAPRHILDGREALEQSRRDPINLCIGCTGREYHPDKQFIFRIVVEHARHLGVFALKQR